MKSNKKIFGAIIIILILILIAGVAFVYVYTSTDILKTEKEMFLKYFNQLSLENTLAKAQIEQFNEKKKQNPYENFGEITVEVEYPDESLEDVMEKVNDLSVSISGKVDSQNEKIEQNIEVDYGNDVIFPITYKQDKDTYGLKIEKVSKQYIAVREDEIEELIRKVFSTSSTVNLEKSIPAIDMEKPITSGETENSMTSIYYTADKVLSLVETIKNIDKEISDKIKFTEEEKKELTEVYGTVLKEQLPEESFSSIKNGENENYTLELTYEQIKNILIKMLETTKENTLIIDKLNKIILEQEPESEKIDASMVDELIKELEKDETTDIPNLKITLSLENKQLNEIIIQLGETTISILKRKTEDTLSYSIEIKMVAPVEENGEIPESTENIIHFEIQYNGLKNLDIIQENYEVGFETIGEDVTMKFDYKINSNTEFKESVSIDEIDEDSTLFLNDYDKENIASFLEQMGTRIATINKNQMEELGLEETQNPLLYSNPITLLMMQSLALFENELPDNMGFSEYEIQSFNDKFTKYVGKNVRGTEVNALIKTVQTNNLSSSQSSGHLVKAILNGDEKWENVDTSKRYEVKAIYDEDGFVKEMQITVKD